MKKKAEQPILPNTVLVVYAHPEATSWTGLVKDRVEDTLYSVLFHL